MVSIGLLFSHRTTLRIMRLVLLLWQLVFFLRTQAQIPDACLLSDTNRSPGLCHFYPHSLVPVSADFHLFLFLPENSDITVVCGTQYMDLSIYLCPIYHAFYNESLMVVNSEFNNLECFGTPVWNVDPPLLKFTFPINESSISSCNNKFEVNILHYYFQSSGELRNLCVSFRIWGYYMVQVGYGIWQYYCWKLISCFSHKVINQAGTGQFSDFSNVQYINISGVVNSIDPAAGMITYRPQILYKFSCLYPMQYLLNNTEMAVWVCHTTHGMTPTQCMKR